MRRLLLLVFLLLATTIHSKLFILNSASGNSTGNCTCSYTATNPILLSGSVFSFNQSWSDMFYLGINSTAYNSYRLNNQLASFYLNASNIDSGALGDSYISSAVSWNAKAATGTCPPGQVVQNTTTGGVQCIVAGSGGTPSGDNTSLQFNDGGSFGGSSNLTWNKINQILAINGTVQIGSLNITDNGTAILFTSG